MDSTNGAARDSVSFDLGLAVRADDGGFGVHLDFSKHHELLRD